jgi:anaerobic magnesium-protoporphyrin IX monomethyl ester cyclase
MDYLLINPTFDNPGGKSVSHGDFKPYGLLVLDFVLRQAGYSGKLLLDPAEWDVFMAEPRQHHPKVVGFTGTTFTRFDAIRKIRKCRELFPEALIVAGGPHFGCCAQDSIRHISQLDVVVRGEGSQAILELMRVAQGRISIEQMDGITHRNSSGAVVERGERIVLDTLPDIRFMERFYTDSEFANNPLNPARPIPSMNVIAGIGCPHECIFCSVNRMKNRTYPAKQIVDVIETITRKHGIRGVKFFDDTLTIRESFVRSLCEEILRRNLTIEWFCDSRANIDLDLIPLMYSAGCRFISVGLESGSPKIQKTIRKNISNEQVIRFCERCKQVGIRPFIFLMAGFPDETPEDLRMTVQMAATLSRRYGAIAGGMGITSIMPGTQLEQIARERGLLPSDFSWAEPYCVPSNVAYGQVPSVPIYAEALTPELFQQMNREALGQYAAGLPLVTFVREAVENLLRHDLSWRQKYLIGKEVMSTKVRGLFS